MTRLVREDIFEIEKKIKEYDSRIFKVQTGHTMDEVSRIAAGVALESTAKPTVATVTVTSGLGVISGFAGTNAAILRHCGIQADELEKTDVAGIQEAFEKRYDLILMADDDIYSMFGAGVRAQSDNGDATGKGYAAALIEAIKNRGISVEGQKILVLGAGPVGRAAAEYISSAGAVPCVYDLLEEKARSLSSEVSGAILIEGPVDYKEYAYILDATTAGGLISEEDVTEDTIISAPGVPCIATEGAAAKAAVIHNPLELGTITMYYQCVRQMQDAADVL